MDTERKQRGVRLTPEQQWQVFLEVSRKNTTDVEVCRKWGISTYQLKAIRQKAKDGSVEAFKKGPGRSKADKQVVQLRQDLERSNEALKELAIENTLLRGKVNGV